MEAQVRPVLKPEWVGKHACIHVCMQARDKSVEDSTYQIPGSETVYYREFRQVFTGNRDSTLPGNEAASYRDLRPMIRGDETAGTGEIEQEMQGFEADKVR